MIIPFIATSVKTSQTKLARSKIYLRSVPQLLCAARTKREDQATRVQSFSHQICICRTTILFRGEKSLGDKFADSSTAMRENLCRHVVNAMGPDFYLMEGGVNYPTQQLFSNFWWFQLFNGISNLSSALQDFLFPENL